MSKFVRTEDHDAKLFKIALIEEKNVYTDVEIKITHREKAYCEAVHKNCRFPKNLRFPGSRFIADVVEVKPDGAAIHYRAVKGTIRRKGSDEVIA